MQTYDQLLRSFSNRAMELRFSYPGNEGCIISAENQIRFACDGTPIDMGRLIYRAGRGADTEQFFKTAKGLFEAPIYGGRSIHDRWDEIIWETES